MAVSTTPRWKVAITSALAEYDKYTVLQLSTIDPTAPIPHVRSLRFREFITPATKPSLPLVLSTTDIRSAKVGQIVANPHVQLAWWIEGTQEQFRISGLATIIPAKNSAIYEHFLHNVEHAAPNSSLAALKEENFDWEAKRIERFKGMSPYMKATWCRPPPGTPLQGGEEETKKWPVKLEEPGEDADEVTKKNWETALGNFALLIIDPTDVDYCYVELGVNVVPDRRTRFWKTNDGSWESEALVP